MCDEVFPIVQRVSCFRIMSYNTHGLNSQKADCQCSQFVFLVASRRFDPSTRMHLLQLNETWSKAMNRYPLV
jgi:hypothetical protein